MRFYLLDRITHFELQKEAHGIKCWSMDNDAFNDHFPGFPVVPGVLATESMAQLLGTLIERSYRDKYPAEENVYAVLSIIHKSKFKNFMIPGDQVIMKAKLHSLDLRSASGEVKAYVNDELICKAEFSYGLIDNSKFPNQRLAQMRDEYFHVLTNADKLRTEVKNVR